MKWLIVILILSIVLIAGCTQLSSIDCKPNWKIISAYVPNEEYCNSYCYQTFKTNHYRIENNSDSVGVLAIGIKCYCDVNNCNP